MKKRNTSHKKIITLLFILLCLIIAGFAFLLIKSSTKSAPKKVIHTAAAEVQIVPISQLLSSLNTKLVGSYPDLSSTSPDQTSTLGYRVNKANYTVALPLTNSLTYEYSQTASESGTYSYMNSTLPTITRSLKAQGFAGPDNATPSDSILNSVYFYQSKTSVCEVTVYSLLDVTCASLDDLSKLSSSSSQFADLYLASQNGSSVVRPSILSVTIDTSKNPDYETAVVNFLSGSIQTKVYYYRQTPAQWSMVNLGWYNDPQQDGNIIPNCTDFDSLTATREAFDGLACYNSTRRTTSEVY
jgi:hypothetical protein